MRPVARLCLCKLRKKNGWAATRKYVDERVTSWAFGLEKSLVLVPTRSKP